MPNITNTYMKANKVELDEDSGSELGTSIIPSVIQKIKKVQIEKPSQISGKSSTFRMREHERNSASKNSSRASQRRDS